ncbi:MAG: hypothetical protein WDN75_04660 [Bacteroidota bacterium]
MNYPRILIPKILYKKISINRILEGNVILIRLTSEKRSTQNGSNPVNVDAIVEGGREKMIGLSLNLYGVYQTVHVKFKVSSLNKILHDYWKEWTFGLIPGAKDVTIEDDRGYYFVPLDKIHTHKIPNNPANNHDFNVFCEVVHMPTKCNFWHVQLQWLSNGEVITKEDEIWKRPIQTVTRAMIQKFGQYDLPKYKKVRLREYCMLFPVFDKY